MDTKRLVRGLFTLALLGQIIFYTLSFSKVIGHVHGDGNAYAQAIGGLFGIDFLAVQLTGACLLAYEGQITEKLLRIGVYVFSVPVVALVLFDNINAWIR